MDRGENLLHKRLVDRSADQEQHTETRKITEVSSTMKKQLPRNKAKPEINSVILDGPPPIQRIIKDIESVSAQTIAIYAHLWESAYWAQNIDRAGREFWSDRRDTGGTTHWSIDGLAKQLRIGHTTAEKAINSLINHGFIRVLHFVPTKKGKRK